jgi:prevent-host-death family protein
VAGPVNVHAAKTDFSWLLERVEAGEEIVIARAGKPIARLVPLRTRPKRKPGALRGRIHIASDFDAPLPPDVVAAFVDPPIEPPVRRKRSRR